MGSNDTTRRSLPPASPGSGPLGRDVPADEARLSITRVSLVEVPAERHEPPSAPAPAGGPGTHVAVGTLVRERYELESVLGEGGMGVVYRALDHLHKEMHDRDPYVAIKILNEEYKRHPQALIALQRETRKAQTLAHENIISVYNFDRDGSTVYMTMELLDGNTLGTIIAENGSGLATRQAVPMIRGMAKALAYAHENDIVHSDFKPGNVFLTRKQQVKVLDFGVARAAPANLPADPDGTPLDVRELGGMTPAYASLQMLDGDDPTPPDDVFALAVVAWELLTGRHPFDGFPVDEQALHRLKPKALSGLARTQRRALLRALSSDRESRHAHAGEFLKEFDRTGTLKKASAGIGIAAALPAAALILSTQNIEPEIAFAELPLEVQQQFNDVVREGETALNFGDAGLNDAFLYFSEAYELHPDNARAVEGLGAVADRFLASAPGADAATQRDVFELLHCQSYLSRYAPLAGACADLLGAEQCATIADGCRAAPAE